MSTTTSWLEELCGTTFMPHGQCYLWDPNLLWLHGVSDSLIALAYFSIPIALLNMLRQRRDLPYPGIIMLFGAFIIACGLTHLLEVVTLWHPYYWLTGSVKGLTAIVSLATAVALVRVMPAALLLPSPKELREYSLALEEKVRLRTDDLTRSNDELRHEIKQRQDAELEVKRLNTILEHQLEEMKTLVDLLPVGVAIAKDATGQDIQGNRAMSRMLGLPEHVNTSLSAPEGKAPVNFKVFAFGKEMAPEELPIQRCLRENAPVLDLEEVIERSDGVRIVALANAVPVQDESGNCRGCVATFQDITSLREMEARRREMDHKLLDTQKLESLGVMAGGIAHDFNNLLTGILGNASLARMELSPGSSLKPHLEQIEQATRRAADLCQQMLAYSGRGRFVVQTLDLNELIRDTTHLLTISISKSCVLRFNLADTLPPVTADATQMRQIIMNLVINASEAIGERSGVIAIASGALIVDAEYLGTLTAADAITPGHYAFIEISDNGTGMDAATIKKIFDPFFTTKFTGRGLGLAAVLGIVRGHKGALKVYSEPGKGTTFKLLLPAAENVPAAAPTLAVADEKEWRGQGTVLVVDDEESVRQVASRLLAKLGFTTETATDGRDALEKFRQQPSRYALVLLDLTMPRLDGEETFRQLRHLHPGVRVVLMSGFSHHEALDRFAGKGLAGFIQKPFEVAAMIRTLREVILKT